MGLDIPAEKVSCLMGVGKDQQVIEERPQAGLKVGKSAGPLQSELGDSRSRALKEQMKKIVAPTPQSERWLVGWLKISSSSSYAPKDGTTLATSQFGL